MPYVFNPFTGSLDNAPSTNKGNSAYTTVQQNSASWGIDSGMDTGVRSLTSNWQNTFTTVQNNSSTWDYQGTDLKNLSSGWVGGNDAYTNLVANSAAYLSSFNVDLSFLSVSGNWNSVYTTVQENSAVWGEILPTVVNYLSTNNVLLSGLTITESVSVRGGMEVGGEGTSTLYVEKKFVGINTETPNEELTVVGNISSSNVIYASGGNSNIWNYTHTFVQENSAFWLIDSTMDTAVRSLTSNWESTYTTVLGNSATWDYQGTDLKNLSSGWVGGNDAYTNLVANSAAYLSAVDLSFLSVSGNWNSTYTTVSSNSAHWESAYTTLQTNSATWNTIVGGTSEVLIAEVKNAEGITLNRGDVVYTFGATGGTMSVKLASDANDGTSSKTIGLVNGTIAVGGTGYITTVGRMDQLNLGSFLEGQALWVGSTAGTFTNVRPTAPKHAVYLGVVERANNGNGIAYIKIQNGYELGELHDVLTNGFTQAGDYLQRNSTNTLWVPSTLSANKWNSTYTTVQNNSAVWSAVTSYSSLIGDSTTNPLTATHNLNTKDIIFSIREVSTNKIVYAAGKTVTNNSLELTFDTIPTVNQYELTVLSKGGVAAVNGSSNFFSLTSISSSIYIQSVAYTHNLYFDTISTGQMTVYLLPPANHIGVTQHKKIGSTASVVLSATNGAKIDGQPTYTLTNQYEAIGLYTDGTNYFIQ